MNWTVQNKYLTYKNKADEFVGEVVIPISIGALLSHGFFTLIYFAAK
jgi:hypothetical protein